MIQISADLVKKLRELTDAPMLECKKALTQAEGDLDKAQQVLRELGQANATKRADREAIEGQVGVLLSVNGREAVVVEINSETDFVSRGDHFKKFLDEVLKTALSLRANSIEALKADPSIEQLRLDLVTRLGENIRVRRVQYVTTTGTLGYYVHLNKIGVVVCLQGGDSVLAKDVAVHIASRNPQVVRTEEMSSDQLQAERQVALASLKDSDKPAHIQEKIVENKIKEYLKETVLMEQLYLKDDSKTIAQLLSGAKAQFDSFVRFQLGEGLERTVVDFAAEVMKQVEERQ